MGGLRQPGDTMASCVGLDTACPEADFPLGEPLPYAKCAAKVGTLVTLDLSAPDAGTLVTAGYPMPSRLASCWGTAGADG
jgi:hypothetical protein